MDVSAEEVFLNTQDGLLLEGELAVPGRPVAAAVLTHPLPTHGGNMQSIVPGALFNALPAEGIACLRFNFRGIGRSQGTFDDGVGEQLDILAAIEVIHPLIEGLPLYLAGWSFGADTSLCVADRRLTGWFAVAPPLRAHRRSLMVAPEDPRPKRLVIPERDQFLGPEQARAATARWKNCKITVVPGADHFLVGRTERVVDEAVAFTTAGC